MPEIRTCEEYVLRELENSECALQKLEEDFHSLESEYLSLKSDYDTLVKIITDNAKIDLAYDGKTTVIHFATIWENDSKEEFNELVRQLKDLNRDS